MHISVAALIKWSPSIKFTSDQDVKVPSQVSANSITSAINKNC